MVKIAELKASIEQAEQLGRYYDAAEGRQWFAERSLQAANEARLTLLKVKLADAEYAAEAADDWNGLECSEALDGCDREACRQLLNR